MEGNQDKRLQKLEEDIQKINDKFSLLEDYVKKMKYSEIDHEVSNITNKMFKILDKHFDKDLVYNGDEALNIIESSLKDIVSTSQLEYCRKQLLGEKRIATTQVSTVIEKDDAGDVIIKLKPKVKNRMVKNKNNVNIEDTVESEITFDDDGDDDSVATLAVPVEPPDNPYRNPRSVYKNKSAKYPRNHICSICGAGFFSKNILRHHTNRHYKKPRNYKCKEEECYKTFTTLHDLRRHHLTHDGDKPYTCSHCDSGFKRRNQLQSHISNVHKGEKLFPCRQCDQAFFTRAELHKHNYIHKKKEYECTYCGRRFDWKSHFDVHMKSHTGEKSFTCHICGKQFVRRHDISRHMSVHTQERPFGCSMDGCNKNYQNKSDLHRHYRMVHKDYKPYECKKCDMSYTTSKLLRKHSQLHKDLEKQAKKTKADNSSDGAEQTEDSQPVLIKVEELNEHDYSALNSHINLIIEENKEPSSSDEHILKYELCDLYQQ